MLADFHDDDVLPTPKRGRHCPNCGDWPMPSSTIQPDYLVFRCDSCGYEMDEDGEPHLAPSWY